MNHDLFEERNEAPQRAKKIVIPVLWGSSTTGIILHYDYDQILIVKLIPSISFKSFLLFNTLPSR